MFIESIRLQNFKNFKDVEVRLNTMNVIVGANASGKSNFVEAFRFLKNIVSFGIDNAISLSGGIEYLQNIQLDGKMPITLTVELPLKKENIPTFIGENILLMLNYQKIVYFISILVKKSKRYEVQKEELVYYTTPEQIIEKTKSNIVIEPNKFNFSVLKKGGELSFKSSVKKDKILLTLADRTQKEFSQAQLASFFVPTRLARTQERKTLLEQLRFFININFNNVFIYDFDLKKAKESASITSKMELEGNGENLAVVIKRILEDKEKSQRLSNLMADILPFVSGLDVEKFYDKSLLFKVKEAYNSASLPSSLLSDGTISITAILVALFFEKQRLAIFEEPEHGLHPALIAKVDAKFL